MRAISVRAPWWWFILQGKDVENRRRKHPHRGPTYLHASSWWQKEEVLEHFELGLECASRSGLVLPPITLRQLQEMGGHLVGRMTVTGCVTSSPSPWFFGPYGFQLDGAKPLARPIRCSGALGFFDVSEVLRRAA